MAALLARDFDQHGFAQKLAPADTGAEVCTKQREREGACSCQQQITSLARMALGRPAESRGRLWALKSPRL